jgi:hypothetical protein
MGYTSPLPLANNLVAKALNERNAMDRVANISGFYETPFLWILNAINKSGSKQVNTVKYEKNVMDNLTLATPIAGNALVGQNLVLTLTDANYDNFRTGWVLTDDNRVQGRVVSHAPGTVTISPQGTAFVAATHFTNAMQAHSAFNLSTISNNRGTESLQYTPDTIYNYSSVTRNTAYVDNSDMLKTYPKWAGKDWFLADQILGLQQWAKDNETKHIIDVRGQVNDFDGVVNHNGGLIWSIQQRGGYYVSSPTLYNMSALQDQIFQLKINNGNKPLDLVCMLGAAAMKNIQLELGLRAQYAGTNNLFGGSKVEGDNITQYKLLDTNIRFVPAPFLDNPLGVFNATSSLAGANGTSRGSNSAFLIDIHDVPNMDGGTQPCIELFHFGREFTYGVQKGMGGMMDIGGSMPSDIDSATPEMVISDISGTSFHTMGQNGIDIVSAKGMSFFEPQS